MNRWYIPAKWILSIIDRTVFGNSSTIISSSFGGIKFVLGRTSWNSNQQRRVVRREIFELSIRLCAALLTANRRDEQDFRYLSEMTAPGRNKNAECVTSRRRQHTVFVYMRALLVSRHLDSFGYKANRIVNSIFR